MNVQDLLNQIQELGYRFELVGDGIKFTYTKGSQTPREAIPILKHFKERKQEVIGYLQQQSKPELQKPIIKQYELTERGRELEKIIGKPDMNPNRHPCVKCGKLAGRYCLGHVNDRLWWAWWCLECRPYTEPERN